MVDFDRRQFLKMGFGAAAALILPEIALGAPLSPETPKQTPDESELVIYYPQTGHNVAGKILDFYRRHQNGELIGLPITEALLLPDGRLIQYFENVALEEDLRNGETVQLANLGERMVLDRHRLEPAPLYIHEEFFRKHGDERFFGPPISMAIPTEEGFIQHTQNMGLLQRRIEYPPLPEDLEMSEDGQHGQDRPARRIFQGLEATRNIFVAVSQYPPDQDRPRHLKRLIWPGEIEPLPLGKKYVQEKGISTDRTRPHPQAQIYFPNMWDQIKQLEINLKDQSLSAFEGQLSVMKTEISSGRDGYTTPSGKYNILSKTEVTDYYSPFPEHPYLAEDVPFNLEFRQVGYYIHGSYWHDKFGRIQSFGCVNLNLDDAKWLYDWARVGTPVLVTS